jgi:hypothetical protein
VGDQKLVTTTNTEYDWNWTVQDVDDQGTATLLHKFTALRVESTGKDFDYRYDSAQGNPSQDDYAKKLTHLYEQLRFGEYRVRLQADGKIASVTGFDKLLGEIGADATVLDFHATNLRDDTFAWFVQQPLGVLPPKPARSWEVATETKLSLFGQLQGKTAYIFGKAMQEESDKTQLLQFTGSQALELDTKWFGTSLRGPLKMSKLQGTIVFDPGTQTVRRGSAQVELAGDLLFGNENNPAKMKLKYEHTLELEAKP